MKLFKFLNIWLIFLIGVIIFGIGIVFYIDYQTGMPSERPRGDSGIMFGYYPEHGIYDVRFLMEVSPQKRTIWLKFSFACYNEGKHYMMISFPYIIDSISGELPHPPSTIAEWNSLNATNGSLVLVAFDVKDPNSRQESRGMLKVVEPIVLSNYGYYVVDMPFGSSFSTDV